MGMNKRTVYLYSLVSIVILFILYVGSLFTGSNIKSDLVKNNVDGERYSTQVMTNGNDGWSQSFTGYMKWWPFGSSSANEPISSTIDRGYEASLDSDEAEKLEEETEIDLVENDEDIFVEAAPRSYDGEYNEFNLSPEFDEKYVLYNPTGGWNNQRECFEYALEIGKLLNRTVLVPMSSKHASSWSKYLAFPQSELFPLDRILNFKTIWKYHRAKPLNRTVNAIANAMKKILGPSRVKNEFYEIFRPYKVDWGAQDVLEWRSINAKVIYLKGHVMYHKWFSTPKIVQIRQHMQYTDWIRASAIEAASMIGPTQPNGLMPQFSAAHIRRGDKSDRTLSAYAFISLLKRAGVKSGSTVYIATEPSRDNSYFRPLVNAFNVTFSQKLSHRSEPFRKFKYAFPLELRADMMGIIEQLICVQGKAFVGSPGSTFSSFITFMRKKTKFVFPELTSMQQKQQQQQQEQKSEEKETESLDEHHSSTSSSQAIINNIHDNEDTVQKEINDNNNNENEDMTIATTVTSLNMNATSTSNTRGAEEGK